MAVANELVEIGPAVAVCPDHVAYVRRVSGREGCEVVMMTNGSDVLKSSYTYEYTCKLLSTNSALGDGFVKFKSRNPNTVDDGQ